MTAVLSDGLTYSCHVRQRTSVTRSTVHAEGVSMTKEDEPAESEVVAPAVVDDTAGARCTEGVSGRGWASVVGLGVGVGATVALFTASGGIAAVAGTRDSGGDLRLRADPGFLGHRVPQGVGRAPRATTWSARFLQGAP